MAGCFILGLNLNLLRESIEIGIRYLTMTATTLSIEAKRNIPKRHTSSRSLEDGDEGVDDMNSLP